MPGSCCLKIDDTSIEHYRASDMQTIPAMQMVVTFTCTLCLDMLFHTCMLSCFCFRHLLSLRHSHLHPRPCHRHPTPNTCSQLLTTLSVHALFSHTLSGSSYSHACPHSFSVSLTSTPTLILAHTLLALALALALTLALTLASLYSLSHLPHPCCAILLTHTLTLILAVTHAITLLFTFMF